MEPIDQVREMLRSLVGGPDTPFMERRAQAETFAASFVTPPDIHIKLGSLGGVGVEWVTPRDAHPSHVFFHLHGGGYVLGNPASSRPFTTEFARLAKCRVVSIDYRLAPENPFPIAIGNSTDAYRALLARGQRASDIAIGGESAGGGLAVATLIAGRNAKLPMPASIIAISPWTDMHCDADSFRVNAGCDPLLTSRSLGEMAAAYLAGATPRTPLASPAFADLSGLPPLLIHVGTDEVLLDDARALHAKAVAGGVDSRIEIWPGMIHVWHMFHPLLPEGREAIARLAAFANEKWNEAAERTNKEKTTKREE